MLLTTFKVMKGFLLQLSYEIRKSLVNTSLLLWDYFTGLTLNEILLSFSLSRFPPRGAFCDTHSLLSLAVPRWAEWETQRGHKRAANNTRLIKARKHFLWSSNFASQKQSKQPFLVPNRCKSRPVYKKIRRRVRPASDLGRGIVSPYLEMLSLT